jgi:hypothetical protein
MMATKAQIWSIDLVFALVVFGFTITLLTATWAKLSNDISVSRSGPIAVLALQTKSFSDTLMSPGYPQNWYSTVNTVNTSTWSGVVPGIISSSSPGVISPPKLYSLIALSAYSPRATESLFGNGYNYFVQITGGANSGWTNITIGTNPLKAGATDIYVVQRSATLNGAPVSVNIMLWTNSTAGAG